mmetsp:Transcript_43864/g.139705  ORF Transcript_43864/g.139705 Transcript_43864/m.139705 type:complete len:87 (+) Transcript_43864:95-355(+)
MGHVQASLCAECAQERVEVVMPTRQARALSTRRRSISGFEESCHAGALADTLRLEEEEEEETELADAPRRHRTISIAMTSADISLA